MLRWIALMVLIAFPLNGEEAVVGLSQNRVAITANFDGSEILIFGGVKRDAPASKNPLSVIITVAGPSEAVTIRRKSKRFGIWINTASSRIESAPSFYSVATTGPFESILKDTQDSLFRISIPRAITSIGGKLSAESASEFRKALIRIRTDKGLYQMKPETVQLDEETLFRTSIALPSNLTEGDYTARIFLIRDGIVVDAHETAIDVRKVGLERWLFALAHEKPLIYGLLSLFIAIVAGWGASSIFRYFRA